MLEGVGGVATAWQGRRRNLYEFCFFLLFVVVVAFDLPKVSFDSPMYIAMAEGQFEKVLAPFSDRVLVPLLSASIHSALGIPIAASFAAISLVGAALFFICVTLVYRHYGLRPYTLLPALLAVPWVIDAVRDAYLPDSLVMGLTCLFLVLVLDDRWLAGAIVGFLSILARETSLILIFFAIGFAAHQRRWSLAVIFALAGVAAVLVVKEMAPAVPNVHAMNGLLYMALKIPVNFLRNVLGVQFWLNDMHWCSTPLVSIPVRPALSAYLGKITAIGVCAPNLMAPITNGALVLSLFGVLPAMTVALVSRSRRELRQDPWLLLVVLYGGSMFFLGICTGESVCRLLTYGWPLFVFAMPILWQAHFDSEPFDSGSLMAAQLGLSWLGPILGSAVGKFAWWEDAAVASAVALIGLVLNGWAYHLVDAKRLAARDLRGSYGRIGAEGGAGRSR
jgi:hypothetical protein